MGRMKWLLCVFFLCSVPVSANTYSTSFAGTENPISEGGNWINGGVTGLDWTNVAMMPGLAYGTMPGTAAAPQQYADSTAALTGSWGPNQTAQATVRVSSASNASGVFEEVELRLHVTIGAHSITGYEINCSVNSNNPYNQIVRWNGALASWTQLNGNSTGCANGDVLKATIDSSGLITVYINGAPVENATDTTFKTGSPGMGFFLQGATGINANYGFSSFTATDGIVNATPAMVQHVSTGRENTGGSNPRLKVTLPNPTLAGNALILGVEGNSGLAIATPTDDKGNTWIAGPSVSSGGQTIASFYALNVAAGTQVITTGYTGNATSSDISAVISEFNNVQTSGPIGPMGSAAQASPVSITLSGSPAPGDLVWMWGADTASIDPVLTNITAGTSFTLLSANREAGKMAQYSTSLSNPTASFTTSGSDPFNAVALTLHAATAGNVAGSGIRIVHMQGEWYDTTTHTAQFPSSGNLLVISLTSKDVTISAVSDSNGNIWSVGAAATTATGQVSQILYAANAKSSPDLTISLTYSNSTSQGLNFVHFYDISGALASPHDVDDTRTGSQTTNDNLTSGVITPNQTNSLTLNSTSISGHTINGTVADANGHTPTLNQAVDSIDDNSSGGTPPSHLDDDSGRASITNIDTTPISFVYTNTAGTTAPTGVGDWASVTSVFKGQPDTQAPTTPTKLVANALSSSQVALSWTASTDNVGVTGYNIFRNSAQVGTTTGDSYTDANLNPSTTYTYNVSALDGSGNTSQQSNSASATTLAPGSGVAPTVTFTGAPATASYGSSFTVTATTNASTTATITASGACSISGDSVTMTSGTGTCSLTASWAADNNYSAATASQSPSATQIMPAVTFTGAPASAPYKSKFTVATTTSASTKAVITASGACSNSGSTVTMTSGTGTCSLMANWAADSNYIAAGASQSSTATKITPTVTFTGAPASAPDGAKFTLATTTNASTTAVITASGVCTIAGNTVTMMSSTGTCSLTANWAADNNYVAAVATQSTLASGGSSPTVTFTGAPASAPYRYKFAVATTTNASTTAVITATGACTIAGNTVTMTSGTGTCSLTANWAADNNYSAATASQSTTATKINPTVTFTGAPASAPYGSTFTVGATTNASTKATMRASGSCSIRGTTVTMTSGSGNCSLTATWSTDNNYVAASAAQSTTATLVIPKITWGTPAAVTYGTALSSKQLDATASVSGHFTYSPAAGTVLPLGNQTLSVTFNPTNTAYYSTATAQVTLKVNQAAPKITWATPAAITSGTPLSSSQLNATASVPGNFVYSPAAGTVLPAGNQTLSVTFTPTDTTDYTTATAQVTLVVNAQVTQAGIAQALVDPASQNVPTFVQQSQTQFSTGSRGTLAFNAATKAGDTIVAYVIWSNTSGVAFQDSLGDTFASVSGPVNWGSGFSTQIFYATHIAGGSDSVTATFQKAFSNFGAVLYIHEYSGISSASPVDMTAAASGSSSSMNSGNATTTSANDLIFGAGVSGNTVTAAGPGFVVRSLAYGNVTEDQIASTAGSYAATATQNSSSWAMQVVAFRAGN